MGLYVHFQDDDQKQPRILWWNAYEIYSMGKNWKTIIIK